MPATFLSLVVAAANTPGKHLAKGTGIGIIVLTAIVATVVVVGVWFALARLLRGPVSRRAHRRGSVGRV